jgi:hypothetical protein
MALQTPTIQRIYGGLQLLHIGQPKIVKTLSEPRPSPCFVQPAKRPRQVFDIEN